MAIGLPKMSADYLCYAVEAIKIHSVCMKQTVTFIISQGVGDPTLEMLLRGLLGEIADIEGAVEWLNKNCG